MGRLMVWALVFLGALAAIIGGAALLILAADVTHRRERRRLHAIAERDRQGCRTAREKGIARGRLDFRQGRVEPVLRTFLVPAFTGGESPERVEAVLAARRMACYTAGRSAGWCEAWRESLAADLDGLPQVA